MDRKYSLWYKGRYLTIKREQKSPNSFTRAIQVIELRYAHQVYAGVSAIADNTNSHQHPIAESRCAARAPDGSTQGIYRGEQECYQRIRYREVRVHHNVVLFHISERLRDPAPTTGSTLRPNRNGRQVRSSSTLACSSLCSRTHGTSSTASGGTLVGVRIQLLSFSAASSTYHTRIRRHPIPAWLPPLRRPGRREDVDDPQPRGRA